MGDKPKDYVAPTGWGYRKRDGTFLKPGPGPAVGYGSRLGAGCYWRFGTEEEFVRKDCVHRYNPGPLVSPGSAELETSQEGARWRRYRLLKGFTIKAPSVARAAFLVEATKLSVRPREPGQLDPPGSHRYRVIGAADWGDYEIVIDLGFWVGPLAILDYACNAAQLAITQRWKPYRGSVSGLTDMTETGYYQTLEVSLPQSNAGFAWGIVDPETVTALARPGAGPGNPEL